MNILLATDGSSYALEAARFLNRILHPQVPAHIDVVAVGPDAPREFDPLERTRQRGVHARGPAESPDPEDWIARTCAEFTAPRLTTQGILLSGDPVEVLPGTARDGRHDLVVAGVKGCGASPFFELGHVAQALFHGGSIPTLLVRKGGGGYAREGSSDLPRQVRALVASDRDPRDPRGEWKALGCFALDPSTTATFDLRGDESSRSVREIDRAARRTEADLVVLEASGSLAGESRAPRSAIRTLVWTSPCSVLLLRSVAATTTLGGELTVNAGENPSLHRDPRRS